MSPHERATGQLGAAVHHVFSGTSALHEHYRQLSWAALPLGAVEHWPHGLRLAVRLCMHLSVPSAVWAGPRLLRICNAAYAAQSGEDGRPAVRPARELWPALAAHVDGGGLGPQLTAAGEAEGAAPFVLAGPPSLGAEEHLMTVLQDADGSWVGIFDCPRHDPGQLPLDRDLRRMFQLSDDLLAVAGVDDRYRRVNPAFTRVLGWSTEEMLSHPVDFFVHPDDRQRRLDEDSLGDGTVSFRFENRYRHRDGSYRWLSWTSAPAPDEGLIYAAARDVTERKAAEQALRRSEERFRALVTASSDVVYRMSADWREMRELHGREFIADTKSPTTSWLETYIHPDDQMRVLAVIEDAIAHKRAFELEHRVLRVDGSVGWTFSRAIAVLDANGEIIEWFGAASDITARKQIEEQLRESDRRKDEFLAMLGHELRNPLAAIRNATELVKLIAPEDGRLRRAHEVLERQSAQMSGLIDGLLEVSRIAQGKVHLDHQFVDIRKVLDDIVHDRASQLAIRDLNMRTSFPTEPLWLWADPVRLAQVFDNLIGNAMKFTPARGSINVSLQKLDAHAVVRVRDTGVGIRPEMRLRLFQPFQQDVQDIARSAGGLGLGLALARGLVELHGGSIDAHSDGPGTGTELTVQLPLAAADITSKPEPKRNTPVARRVLIVEDNEDAGDMLADVLRAIGHEVSVANSGADALAQLRKDGAEIVLCDLGLPGMSGYEVAQTIREDPALRATPLVALTGYGQPEDRARSRAAGFDEHLVKPVDLTILAGMVAELTRGPERGR
ncbi:MAG: PAS domain S-box protein [Polyangiales bacterium]